MALTFKGERTVAELNNNLGGFVKDSAFRIYDHGILSKGNVPVKHGDFVSWTGTQWKIEPSLEYATSADIEAVEERVESIGQPLQWKGPATVAQLNAGITGIQEGWTYTLTDAGTLTDGSIEVEAGDEVAWTEDGEWFKVGGESSKLVVFTYTAASKPLLSDLQHARDNGKAVFLVCGEDVHAGSYWLEKGTVLSLVFDTGRPGYRTQSMEFMCTGAFKGGDCVTVRCVVNGDNTWEWHAYDTGAVKYVDHYTSYSDVSASISRGQLPIMTIISSGTTYYYFPFYNGSGRIEFRSIQDGSINCFTWNGTAWVAGDSVIYGMGSDTKSEVDIDQGVLAIDGGNVVTKVTLATVNAVTFSVNENVPAFAIEIDNTGNSNDVDVTVVNGAIALKYSSAAGNQVGAGKYMQLTCVGGCWTLAEFEAPTP